jgi:hypothetical protein
MAMLLLWLGLYQLATGSNHSGYSLFTYKARIGYNIARFIEGKKLCIEKDLNEKFVA